MKKSCANSMLDLTSMPSIERAIEETRLQPINCYTPLPRICEGFIEFIIDSGWNIDLFNSYLDLDLQVVKETPTGHIPIKDEKVTPVALLGATLFNHIEVKINNELIPEFSKNYMYQAYISVLCDLTKFSRSKQLSGDLNLFDRYGLMFITDPKDQPSEINPHFIRRHEVIFKGRVFSLQCPILQDIFLLPRVFPCDTEIRIKLFFNKPEFVLLTPDEGKFHIRLLTARYMVQKYRLTDQALSLQRKMLKSAPIHYPSTVQETKTFYAQKGENSFRRNIILSSVLPRRAFVMQVSRDNFDGELKSNPFSFRNNKTSELYFQIDDQKFPLGIGYKPDFVNNRITKDYHMFLREVDFKNENIVISNEHIWRSDYTIFCAKLTQDHSYDCKYITPPRTGTLELKISWQKPLVFNTVIIVILEFYKDLVFNGKTIRWKDI